MSNLWHRKNRKFGRCKCLTKHDDKGVWAECIVCGEGKANTFISHAVMRSYSDLMEAHKRHNELVDRERA